MEKEFDFLKEFFSEEEDKDLLEAKNEVEDIFRKYVQMTDKISIATIQRKLQIGYAKAAKFIEMMAIKGIVSKRFGVRDILNKKRLVGEAIIYFGPIIRDRNLLRKLNKYNVFAYVINDEFDVNRVDYFWLNRLISEHFVKDEKFMKAIDEIFGTNLHSLKNLDIHSIECLSEWKVDFNLLAIIALQYFAEKLKFETLKKGDNFNKDIKEKIRTLRFFADEK